MTPEIFKAAQDVALDSTHPAGSYVMVEAETWKGAVSIANDLPSREADRCREIADGLAWRPIESAPTNESVLIFVEHMEHYGPGIYRAIQVDMGTGRRWMTTAAGCGRDLGQNGSPTHWRPLPAPPVGTGEV